MKYRRIQYAEDKIRGVCRVRDICFENSASDSKIDMVMEDITTNNVVAPALMTREALALYINAPKYLVDKMARMLIYSNIEYYGLVITRCSEFTYNARKKI